jgi:tellurite resistance protein TerC
MTLESTSTPILYLGFTLLVIVLLTIDFFVLKTQGAHRVSVKEEDAWSVVWIAISLVFGGWLWWYLDGASGEKWPTKRHWNTSRMMS